MGIQTQGASNCLGDFGPLGEQVINFFNALTFVREIRRSYGDEAELFSDKTSIKKAKLCWATGGSLYKLIGQYVGRQNRFNAFAFINFNSYASFVLLKRDVTANAAWSIGKENQAPKENRRIALQLIEKQNFERCNDAAVVARRKLQFYCNKKERVVALVTANKKAASIETAFQRWRLNQFLISLSRRLL